MTDRANALVFGGFGAIGTAIAEGLADQGYNVFRTSRSPQCADAASFLVDPFAADGRGLAALDGLPPFEAVAWAQGANLEDSVMTFDVARFDGAMRANCTYVVATMAALVERDLLAGGARLCVVSSVWQAIARQEKLSYSVSKAAVGALVRAAAVDLAGRGIRVNAVLPGALDTPMTRAMLTSRQIESLASATGFHRLTSLGDVVSLVCYLCSDVNTGVTGQSIAVDLGFTVGRIV